VHFRRQTYDIKFRGFTVRPEFHGQGVAKMLLRELAAIGKVHHDDATASGEKPNDIGLMFLKSLVYFDADRDGEAFAFGRFLKKAEFTAHAYNALDLDAEEIAGIEAYQRLYPELKDRLKIFRLPIVDTGIKLKDEAKAELLKLSPEELAVVMHGLDVKLGSFERNGRVSYRYDLCPICKYMGSSEQNSDNCKRCGIYLTCMEPFREQGRFKEDYAISAAYFTAMRDFLLRRNTPK
jgi:GNAT superfamily N-acetyltransferase